MSQVIFIIWRESIEAILIVGIIYTWLKNSNAARQGLPYLWLGILLGLCLSLVLAISLYSLKNSFLGNSHEYFQIFMLILACILIIQMIIWMEHHNLTIKKKVDNICIKRNIQNWWKLTILVAFAVAREGSETIIFLYNLNLSQINLFSAVVYGITLAFCTYYIMQISASVFTWKIFFCVTKIILLFLVASFLETVTDHLIGLELLNPLYDQIWNTSWLLDDSSIFGSLAVNLIGYRSTPSLTNLLVYLCYWIIIWFLTYYVNNYKFSQKENL